jgi:hypothetical protein
LLQVENGGKRMKTFLQKKRNPINTKIFFNSLEIVFLRSIAQKIKKTFFIKYVSLRTFIIQYLFVSGREDGSDSTQPEQTSKLRIQDSGHLNITIKTQDQRIQNTRE